MAQYPDFPLTFLIFSISLNVGELWGFILVLHLSFSFFSDVDHFYFINKDSSLLNLLQYCSRFMFWFLAMKHVGSYFPD